MINIQQKTNKPFAFCLPSIADSFEAAKDFKTPKKVLNKNNEIEIQILDLDNFFSTLELEEAKELNRLLDKLRG